MSSRIVGKLHFPIVGDASGATGAIDDLERKSKDAAKKIDRNLSGIADSMVKVGKQLSTFVTLPILGIGIAAVKTAADYEKHRVALETMLGSAEKAQTLLRQIEAFSASTPFQLPGLIEGSKRLLAFGVAAEDIVGTMRNLGNAAQGNQGVLDRLTLAYGKLLAKGRATLEELNMFTEAGVPILAALAEKYDVTTAAMFKLIETGQVGFEDVDAALRDLTTGQGQFAGLIEKQAETLSGLISTLKDNVGLLAKEFGEILAPGIKNATRFITEIVQELQQMDDRQRRLIVTLAGVAAGIGPVIAALGLLTRAISVNPYVALAGAIVTIGTGLATWVRRSRDVKDEQKELKQEVDEVTESIEQQNFQLAQNSFVAIRSALATEKQSLANMKAAKGWDYADRIATTEARIQELTVALEESRLAMEAARDTWQESVKTGKDLEDGTGELTKAQEDYKKVQDELLKQFGLIEERHKALGDEVDVQAEKRDVLTDAIEDLIELGYKAEGKNIQTLLGLYGDLFENLDDYSARIVQIREEYGRNALLELEARQFAERLKREEIEETARVAEALTQQRLANAQQILGAIAGMFSAIGSIGQAHHQAEMQRLDEEYEGERTRIEDTITNEEDKADALTALDEEFDDRRKAAQREAAKAQKQFSIFDTLLSTASAIINAFTIKPVVLAPFMAALAAATGAAQLAAIHATPIPSLDTGGTLLQRDQVVQAHAGETIMQPDQLAEVIRRAVAGAGGGQMIHLTVNVGGERFHDHIHNAMENGDIIVPERSVR